MQKHVEKLISTDQTTMYFRPQTIIIPPHRVGTKAVTIIVFTLSRIPVLDNIIVLEDTQNRYLPGRLQVIWVLNIQ